MSESTGPLPLRVASLAYRITNDPTLEPRPGATAPSSTPVWLGTAVTG